MNGKAVKSNYRVKPFDDIRIVMDRPRYENEIIPEDIPLDIVYEDEDILIVNKPKGMVVHPAPGHYSGTLVNALLYHLDSLSGINGEIRPGIVHRIDMDTTGSLIVCKNDESHIFIAEQIKEVQEQVGDKKVLLFLCRPSHLAKLFLMCDGPR